MSNAFMTQRAKIRAYLEEHGSITPMEAFSKLHITKLSTRIGEMNALGAGIKIEYINDFNEDGNHIRYARYSL